MTEQWGDGSRGDAAEDDAHEDFDEDVTRLSTRRPSPDDDATRLSTRRTLPDDDATRLASRRGGGPDVVDDHDEVTRRASRRTSAPPAGGAVAGTRPAGAPRTGSEPGEGALGDFASTDETTRAAGRGRRTRRQAMLPPGGPALDLPREGDFGTEHERYEARPTPVVPPSTQPATASAVSSGAFNAVLTPEEVAAKRERARRKRLAGIAIAVAAGAALLTAVAVVVLTMLQGAA